MMRGLLVAAAIWAAPVMAQEAWHAEVLKIAEAYATEHFNRKSGDFMVDHMHPEVLAIVPRVMGTTPEAYKELLRKFDSTALDLFDIIAFAPVPTNAVFGTDAAGVRWGIVPFQEQIKPSFKPAKPPTCTVRLFFSKGDGWFIDSAGRQILQLALPSLEQDLPSAFPGRAEPVS